MEATKDEYLKADLACYKRDDRSIPLGPCHTFQFLWDSIKGHIAEFMRKDASSNREASRKKEMNQITAEAA